jgi:hypothetical protein
MGLGASAKRGLESLLNRCKGVFREKRGPASAASAKQAFSAIYRHGTWGSDSASGDGYFSGSGSHDPEIIRPYIAAVSKFLSRFPEKPSAVDLGCGDFNVGSKIRQFCSSYTACDIVDELIERNKRVFTHHDVNFRVLDMIEDDLPKGRVIFLRQVLQHLSNSDISRVATKVSASCEYLLVTEHLPARADFIPNIDIARGHEIRLRHDSGVVLTSPPFELQIIDEQVLCEVAEMGGVIRTTAYRLH